MNDLKFCLVGRGSIGTRHLTNLKSLACNNIIAYSAFIDQDKDREYKTTHGVETFHSVEEIRHLNPTAFIIANPTSRHKEIANIAVSMGSHIFMEKPVSNDLIGIEELGKGVKEKNLVFSLANNFRFHPALTKIKELIDNKVLGEIYFARIMAGQYLPDWHPWEDYRRSYSARRELGGGVVLTLQHELDYAYWLFGDFKTIKSSVKKISNLEIDVDDLASIIIEAESGPLLEIHLDYLQRPPKRTIHIQGENGSVDYRFGDEYLQFYDFEKQDFENIHYLGNYDNNQMYIDELKDFIKCITDNKRPKSSFDDAVYVLKTCLEVKKDFH
jgi:predicted dehydrogenase